MPRWQGETREFPRLSNAIASTARTQTVLNQQILNHFAVRHDAMGAGEAIVKLAAMVDAELVVKSRDDVAGDSRAVGWESTGGVAGSTTKDEWQTDLCDISDGLAECCRVVDATSTDKALEQAEQVGEV